jgi:hypothetical protein
MRNKRAKQLRKMARQETVGLPDVKYVRMKGPVVMGACTRRAYKLLKQIYNRARRQR